MKYYGTGVAFPRTNQTLIINIGSNYHTSALYTKKSALHELNETIWINGRQDHYFMLGNEGQAEMYAIGIKLGMLPYLIHMPASETNNLAISAKHCFPKEIFDLRDQLAACHDRIIAFKKIERFLWSCILTQDLSEIKKIDWIQKSIHTYSVEKICHSLGYTRKRLLKESNFYIGDSIKASQGILRLNQTLKKIASGVSDKLNDMHEYYDQAHFINDFKQRTGLTPSQYKKLCTQFPMIKYTPNFLPLSKETFLQFIE